jgi:hypothetical protein
VSGVGPDRDNTKGIVGRVEQLETGNRTRLSDKVITAIITAVGTVLAAWSAAAIGILNL